MSHNDTISKEPDELNWADYFDSLVDQAWIQSRKHRSPSVKLESLGETKHKDESSRNGESSLFVRH